MSNTIDEPEKQPLVSVGIPTYNRPDLLKKSLQSLANQNYSNIEIIIGDNSDPDVAQIVEEICLGFKGNFISLKYFSHIENIGANKNFFFVLDQSSGTYFMWMADDYQILDENYLSELVDKIGKKTLVFPLFILSHLGEDNSRKFFNVYERLEDGNKYLEAWCGNGAGYPFYGLYNRDLLLQGNHLNAIKKCKDWAYFGEGLFLHQLFIDNAVKYCSSVRMFVDVSSSNLSSIPQDNLVRAFCKYTFETARLFQDANLEASLKERVFDKLISIYSDYFASHLTDEKNDCSISRIDILEHQLELANLQIEAMQSSKFWKFREIWFKLKQLLNTNLKLFRDKKEAKDSDYCEVNTPLTRDRYINSPSPIENELQTFFNTKDALVIFDIGSCEGEDSIKYSRIFPFSKIYAVEALPSNLPLLKGNLDKYGVFNVEILPFALSNNKGISKFYVSSGKPDEQPDNLDWDFGNKSSSLLPPDKHLETAPWLKFQSVIDVETRTIKDICIEKGIDYIDFIHMDVQGAELKVLEGAEDILEKVKVIWLEVESITLYENQPLKPDIEEFMQQHSFYKVKDTVNSISGDQLYINTKLISEYQY
jgi:FkbM family methyltransferase